MTKKDILTGIEYYEWRIEDDPAGKVLYETKLQELREELKKYEKTK